MASEQAGDRSEKPTQTRRDEFRKTGQVVQSRELATAALLLFSAMSIFVFSRYVFKNIYEIFEYSFGANMVRLTREGRINEATQFGFIRILYILTPVFGFIGIIGVASSVLQVGFLKVEDALTPDLNKLNPLEGMKRLFSLKSVVEALKAVLKLVSIGFIVYLLLKNEAKQLPFLISYNIPQIINYLGIVIAKLLGGVGGTILVLAGADYLYQKWELEKRMMMTKQEIKEEHKQREGDPLIRSRVRRLQKERAQKRMMEAIPKADVVITNPTHLAIVLKYDEKLPAPQLVAKGADFVAEKIRELARIHNIPIIENKPLARTIFKTMKIGQVIPKELFVAVAEVLSYVFKLKKKKVHK